MAEDRLQSLRRLAKTYHITFRSPSDEWPAAHTGTFKDIKTLGDHKFDSYCESVSIRSAEEPWTQQTKARAEWLAMRASRLFGQQRNEAGWRYGLENDVLRRFSVEVACPKCRARVWRSEIEATLNDDNYGQRLEQRRKERQRCHCPPECRPQDYYEIGTNPLFDDRTQEAIIHNDLSSTQIPKQEPDRVYGLQATKSFQELLSRPVASAPTVSPNDTLADHVRTSPFRPGSDPLLFPFLLLEAKSETSTNGFDDIQVQSALPLWALLRLQEELQSHQQGSEPPCQPFTWFLATRGDTWRVYGCYSVKGENGMPTKYDIMLLWNGSLLLKDDALQLILIVDYILDWARDIYRPSILKQLKSITTGRSFDQVSLTDSDIFSIRGRISNWIPAPPTTVAEDNPNIGPGDLESDENPSVMPLEHQSLLPIPIPNTSSGSVRSALLSDFRFVSLHLTEELVLSLLQLVETRSRTRRADNTTTVARRIVNFITEFDEILVLTGADLDQLEATWTGTIRLNGTSATKEFYVVIEAYSYLSPSWDIVREISCLAVSKPALDLLIWKADFVTKHSGIERLPQSQRACSWNVLNTCIECLRSGSPWQVLLSAISCTLVVFHPLPERRRSDVEPPVEVLGLAYLRPPRVKPFIQNFLKMDAPKHRKTTNVTRKELNDAHHRGISRQELLRTKMKRAQRPTPADLLFKRISHQRTCITQEREHDEFECNRCFQSGGKGRSPHGFLDLRIRPVLSHYHAILVVASEITKCREMITKLDVCLFALDMPIELTGDQVLPVIIEDLAQADMIYYTIHHDLLNIPHHGGIIWNLPLSYRPVKIGERFHIANWIRELHYQPALERPEGTTDSKFEDTQMLLFCLSIGCTYIHAKQSVAVFVSENNNPCYEFFC